MGCVEFHCQVALLVLHVVQGHAEQHLEEEQKKKRHLDEQNLNYLEWLDIVPYRVNPQKWKMFLEYYNSKLFGNKSKLQVYKNLVISFNHFIIKFNHFIQ